MATGLRELFNCLADIVHAIFIHVYCILYKMVVVVTNVLSLSLPEGGHVDIERKEVCHAGPFLPNHK
jgi:hypothetical protein